MKDVLMMIFLIILLAIDGIFCGISIIWNFIDKSKGKDKWLWNNDEGIYNKNNGDEIFRPRRVHEKKKNNKREV